MSRPRLKKKVRIAALVAVVLCVVAVAGVGTASVSAAKFSDRYLPNTRVGGVDVSGMTHAEAAAALNQTFEAFIAQGFSFKADGKAVTLDRADFGLSDPDLTNDPVRLDADVSLDKAYARGHGGNVLSRGLAYAASVAVPASYPLAIVTDRAALAAALHAKLATLEDPVAEPTFSWKGGAVAVTPGSAGRLYDVTKALDALDADLKAMRHADIALASAPAVPAVSDADAKALATAATALVHDVPLTLKDGDATWAVPADTAAALLQPGIRGGRAALVIATGTPAFADAIAAAQKDLEVLPQEAKFQVQDGRVVAFADSHDGIVIDQDALAAALMHDWADGRVGSVAVPTTVKKALTATADANDLGIKEALGVGVSSFKGSPPNRIKNIRNAVRKLNGLLIPDESEFSLLAALEPFTAAGGYFPELVIKGDLIEPDTGGGACQIGTTTFRAVMNSGLPVLERQNHSLVVRYYGDPKNGNPGTDATIFEPHPDFRFKNDTGHAILFLAAMDETTQQLTFTFWGTSDGRAGSYTPPVVSKWYGAPAGTKTVLSTAIAPGKTQCEPAFRGADASFTYTVTKADGTKEDRVFTSHYRPLIATCLKGVTAADLAAASQTVTVTVPGQTPAPTASSTPAANVNAPVTQ